MINVRWSGKAEETTERILLECRSSDPAVHAGQINISQALGRKDNGGKVTTLDACKKRLEEWWLKTSR